MALLLARALQIALLLLSCSSDRGALHPSEKKEAPSVVQSTHLTPGRKFGRDCARFPLPAQATANLATAHERRAGCKRVVTVMARTTNKVSMDPGG